MEEDLKETGGEKRAEGIGGGLLIKQKPTRSYNWQLKNIKKKMCLWWFNMQIMVPCIKVLHTCVINNSPQS